MRTTRRTAGAVMAALGLILSVLTFLAPPASADAPPECGSSFKGSNDPQLSISTTPAAGAAIAVGDQIDVDISWPTNAWTSVDKVLICVRINGADSDALFYAQHPGDNDGAASYSFAVPAGATKVCVVGRVSGQPSNLNTTDSTHKSNTVCWNVGTTNCQPTAENNQCTPCDEDQTPDGQGNCTPDCTETVENNQCTPCDEDETPDGQGNCTPDCTPTTENNMCNPCDEDETADGQGNCTPDCTPTTQNNMCNPCPEGQTANGQGGCSTPCRVDCSPPPPTTSPDLSADLECGVGGFRVTIDNDGDGEGVVDVLNHGQVVSNDVKVPAGGSESLTVAVPEGDDYDIEVTGVDSFAGTRDCSDVEGEVITPPTPTPTPDATPTPTPVVAPQQQVKGVQVLPRTGSTTGPMVGLGFGLLLVGAGLMLLSRREMLEA